jgi:hypothetical protein
MPRPPLPGTIASLVYWNRLEPLPRTATIDDGLAARLADPLWLLARQWQFGELAAEDAGSPVDLSVTTEAAPISRVQLGPADAPIVDFDPLTTPIEAFVEAEPVRQRDAGLAAECGLHAVRSLRAAGFPGPGDSLRLAYPLEVPAPADRTSDAAGWHAHQLLAGAVPDARLLAADLRGPTRSTVAARLGVPEPDREAVQRVLATWLAWYDALVLEPPEADSAPGAAITPPAWDERRLEHRSALSAVHSTGGVTLVAERYRDGTLDWPDYEVRAAEGLGSVFGLPTPVQRTERLLPTSVTFPGMPARRFWEIEDSGVSFAGLDPGLTDVGRVLLAEFGLVFGDDWWASPLDVPLGTLVTVGPVVVTDSFGIPTPVPRIIRQFVDIRGPSRPWSLAELAAPDDLPTRVRELVAMFPTAAGVLQGEPVERVELGRDEMANLVWAVEHIVQGVSGVAVGRSMELPPDPPPIDPRPASLAYRLGSPVPPHWVAYAPTPVPDEAPGVTQLVRQATAGSRAEITAESAILEEAEVPTGGIVVERAWHLARWRDGSTVLWSGRRVRPGAGAVASGLAWDRTTPG